MERFFKLYVQVLWWLGYVFIKSPCQPLRSTVCRHYLLSIPGILNIAHCTFIILCVVQWVSNFNEENRSVSDRMMYTMGYYVEGFASIFIRITAAISSAGLVHTMRFVQLWNTEMKVDQSSLLVVSTLCCSILHFVYAFFESFERIHTKASKFLFGHYPLLAVASHYVAMLNSHTASLFALSYVVVLSSQLVNYYQSVCLSLTEPREEVATWELKLRFRLLKGCMKRFKKAAACYAFCILTNSATGWLQVLAIITLGKQYLSEAVVQFALSTTFSLVVLARTGNKIRAEVSERELELEC